MERFSKSSVHAGHSKTVQIELPQGSKPLVSDENRKAQTTMMNGNSGDHQNGHGDNSYLSNTFCAEIRAEVKSYFERMFSEQLTVDEIIQMLIRFKDSSDIGEKSIFECMISDLLEEFQFFHNYPDRQLRLAAIFFGNMIKCKMVTNLTLGIVLRFVLNALQKPTDSKMYAFGTKALEQFVEQLHDWPNYGRHILKISHLHNTHPELVANIESVIARICWDDEIRPANGGISSTGVREDPRISRMRVMTFM